MKNFRRNILFSTVVVLVSLSSCFDEKDDDFKIVGAVGTVSVMTVSKSEPTAGEQITVNIRYYSENVAVKQLRLTQTIGSDVTLVSSKDITDFNINNSYVDSFTYTVPAAAVGTKIRLITEIETVNNLTNNTKFVDVTIK